MSEEVENVQMSVKRYDIEAYSWFGTAHWNLVESEVGDFVYASDYDELCERVRKMLATLDMVIVFDGCARKAVEELL